MTSHRNPLDPGTRVAEPDCHVAPRYLAGPRGDLREVTRLLDDAGWDTFTDHEDAFHYFAPDRQVCVTYLPPHTAPESPGREKGLWHLWEREAAVGPAAWHATATDACPPEILGKVILAMANPEPDEPQGSGPYGMGPLADATWRRDAVGPLTVFTAPDDRATVCLTPVPNVLTPNPAMPLTAVWRAEARPDPSTPPIWQADFTASTPRHVITAFCAAMADPTPLPRRASELDPGVRLAVSLT